MKVKFSFDDGDFAKKIKKYAETKPEEIKKEVAKTSESITNIAKSLVPVDTANLKNSISASYYNKGLTGIIGTPVHYAPHVEFGTVYMVAQPFLFPSHEQEIPRFIENLKNILKDM